MQKLQCLLEVVKPYNMHLFEIFRKIAYNHSKRFGLETNIVYTRVLTLIGKVKYSLNVLSVC